MEVVINSCFGGFGLSEKAILRYAELKGINITPRKNEYGLTDYCASDGYFSVYDLERTDSALVQVVKELGKDASGWASELTVVEVPDGVEWQIEEYDGLEHIAEKHRVWM